MKKQGSLFRDFSDIHPKTQPTVPSTLSVIKYIKKLKLLDHAYGILPQQS